MGKKVRRNSKSRNTKSRNNLRRSKVRRNNSTKKARKQRRGSRKQRGGADAGSPSASGPACPREEIITAKLKESQKGEEGKLIRVSILLTGLKKGTKITSQVKGRFKMADLASSQSLCDGFVIGYYDINPKNESITLDEVIDEINIQNFNQPQNGCFLKIIAKPRESEGEQTLGVLVTESAPTKEISVTTYLNPNSRYHLSQMYDPDQAQGLEQKIKEYTCGGKLRIELINIKPEGQTA